MHLRLLDPATDSFEALTTLLHRAYAVHAAKGLRYSATHQSAEVTRQRASQGECWVGELDGRVVATITVTPPGKPGGTGFYARADVAKFNQMAVDPDFKGRGLGARLLEHVEARARAMGAAELACDTSVHARELHALYFRHGFRFVGHCDWRPYVNYTSVMLSKDLVGGAPASLSPSWDRDPDNAWRDRGEQITAVFGQVWRGLPEKLALAAELGYPWREVSTAFLVDDVAHVGVLEIAAVIGGRSVAVGGVHAVGTVPSARGKGAGRRALERALRHVDERFATAYLTTGIPAYFEPFGFRVVPEHRFRVRDPLPLGTAAPMRRLSADVPEDVAFVKQALSRRTAASHRLAVEEEGWFFVIDEVIAHGGFGTLYAADDVLVAWQRDGDRAQILDLVAPSMPRLADIAARLPADLQGIDLLFCPDRLDVRTNPVPGPPDDTVLMVRGEWPLEGPLVLPVHARC